LVAQLQVDQEERWRRGERVLVETYVEQHPTLKEHPDWILDLVFREIMLSQEAGDNLDVAAYCRRFPQFAPQLQPLTAAAENRAWPTVPGYEILSELGRGGMGVVYKARQVGLKRLVALKMIRNHDLAGPTDLARFKNEAEALAVLQHPNIVQIHEVGAIDGAPYLSLEYVDGGALDRKVKEQPLTLPAAVELVETLARAVHAAHLRGIIHRDLKPGNVLLTRTGQPKITDFGVAKKLEDPNLRTQTGAVLGTPNYMAPEQARGRTRETGPAADVYSLGAILYDLITGQPPFMAASPLETLQEVFDQEPVPPRVLNRAVSRDLETICLKCLQKERDRRYASAELLADDLKHLREGQPILARPVSRRERVYRWCRRNPLVAGLLASVAGIFLAAFVLVSWSYWQAVEARDAAVRREKAERWERYRANLAAAGSALELHNVSAAEHALEQAPPEHRGWEWRHFHSQLDAAVAVLPIMAPDPFFGPTFALRPDGRQIAVGTREGQVQWWDVASGRQVSAENLHQKRVNVLRYSPDGRWLASGSDDATVRIGDARTAQPGAVLRGHRAAIFSLTFDPDGAQLASTDADSTLCLWHLKGGAWTRRQRERFQALIAPPVFTPDGTRLAFASGPKVFVWDANKGRSVYTLDKHTATVTHLAISWDGRWLASCSSHPENLIRVWELATGREHVALAGHRNGVWDVAFSPDGTRLVSASEDQTLCLWDVKAGTLFRVLSDHRGPVRYAAFSPDGTRLVSGSADGTARLSEVKSGDLLAVLAGHRAAIIQVSFDRDGSRIVTAAADGTVRIWDTRLFEALLLRGHESYVYDAVWSPDGSQVASAGWDNMARLWDARTGRTLRALKHPAPIVSSAAYDARGARLVTLARYLEDDRGRDITLWDTASGTMQRTWHLPTSNWKDSRAVFNPAGDQIAVGDSQGAVHLFDPARGAEVAVLTGHQGEVLDLAFRPDGTQLASSSADGTVRLWDPVGGGELAVLTGHQADVWRVVYSPDGRWLASGSADKSVRLWNADTHELVAELPHGSTVYGLAFSLDGTRLATGCADNSIRLWDLETHQEVARLPGHRSYVHALAFSRDGTRLVSASGDFTLRVWETRSAQERARAKDDGR
jgi:WD40 repeat protein/tRNA A-37 threonylcarbamoyl transferase component Bud32